MTTEKSVAVIEDRQLAIQELETRFAMATKQRELLENYIKQRLHPGKHFYTTTLYSDEARGGQQKPSLTKEGAELICLAHSLKPHYELISSCENPPLDDSPYQITMKCILERNGIFEGEGIGSASSMVTRKDGTRVQRQRDPGLRHNATIKMACKSAYIAATLNATAASEFFTQDMEEEGAGDEAQPEKKGHYCELHKTVFFKKGRMKNWAHPIDGTDPVEWCNEGNIYSGIKEEQEQAEASSEEAEQNDAPESISSPVPEQSNSKPPAKPEGNMYQGDMNLIVIKALLDQLQWTDVAAYLKKQYKVTGVRVSDLLCSLTREEALAFESELNELLEMK